MVTKNPFAVEECSEGTGAKCGSIYLNLAFERLLRDKLGDEAEKVLTPRCLQAAKTNFDRYIKCEFNPMREYCEEFYEIPLPGLKDIPKIGLEAGFLRLSRYASLFEFGMMK